MSQEKKHIEQQIREKLLQAEVAPSASVWGGIERALDAKRKTAVLLLYRRLGYAAAVLFLGLLSYYFIRSDDGLKSQKNKYVQQIKTDSSTLKSDSVSQSGTIAQALKEKELNPALPIQKEVAIPSLVRTENRFISKEKQGIIAGQTVPEEMASIGILEIEIESIAYRKPAQPEALSSLYKTKYNALSMFKATVYKRTFENEALSDLMAGKASKANQHSWSVGLAFSPTSVDRYSGFSTKDAALAYSGSNGEMQNVASFVNETDLPAYAGGINLGFEISERWSFNSGIYYLKQGQRIENFGVLENSLSESSNSNSYFGNISISNTEVLAESAQLADFSQLTDNISYSRFNSNLLQQFELLEIPLLASYKIINRRLVFSMAAGINQGFLVGNHVYLSNNTSQPIGKTEAINKLIYKSVFGISFEYPLSRKLYFNFSPTLKYQLNNFNKNAVVNERLQYFELKTGLNYRF